MKTFSIILTLLTFNSFAYAQEKENAHNNGLGIGFNVIQIQKDFGLGLNVISPYFFQKKMAIRVKGNIMFNENIQNSIVEWTPYSNISVGFVGVGGMISERIRLYGEGGMIGLIPSKELSDENFVVGGYGHIGVEFFVSNSFNYYIEIGGVGTGARSEKIINKPIYSNGILIGTGIRVFLK